MNDHPKELPLWPATVRIPFRPPLAGDLSTEVCVIGAGIAGLTTAYRLARAGRKVVVVEARAIGSGETERTSAHLALALDDGYAALACVHGAEGAALAAASHAAAIDEIERIVAEEGIDCAFERVDGYLFPHAPEAVASLTEELRASQRAGIAGVELVERTPLLRDGPALRYPRQGQFHPLRYLEGLAAAAERAGARLFCGTAVEEVSGGEPARVRLDGGGVITAGAVVIATNTPFNERLVIHAKQESYRTYVVAASVSGSLPKGLYWDTADPYHYARLLPGEYEHDTVLVGGEDHKLGEADDLPARRYERLEAWARARFPSLGAVTHRWSGQVVATADGLAFIGRNPGDEPNVFVVTGDCGHGMTYGTIAGLMLPDLILGRPHPWEKLYDPSRMRASTLKRWTRETTRSAGRPSAVEVSAVEDIEPGQGAILRRGAKKIAVYRSPEGVLHERSAACTHLGVAVVWNAAARTWDCPAHGSRFTPLGEVLDGPAAAPLDPAPAGPSPKRRAVKRRTVRRGRARRPRTRI